MSVVSGLAGASASKSAGKAQAKAAAYAAKIQKQMYDTSREDQTPWRKAGQAAVNTLWEKIQKGPGDFYEDPGYKFRRAEGEKSLERNAAARGSILSGAQLKGVARFNQDYASNEYNNFLTRYYQSLNPYQSLAGLGQTGVANQNAVGAHYANMMGNTAIQGGNAQAAGYINSANSLMNMGQQLAPLAAYGVGQLWNAGSNAINNWKMSDPQVWKTTSGATYSGGYGGGESYSPNPFN